MRKLKFRVWNIIENRWATVSEIEEIVLVNAFYNGDGFKLDERAKHGLANDLGYKIHIVQYTGLTDRNGKDIYEGDIVQYKTIANDCVGNIRCGEYEQDGSGGEYSSTTCLGFYIQRNRIIPTAWDIECGGPWARDEDAQISPCKTEMEVIGSIYENPELLESSETT